MVAALFGLSTLWAAPAGRLALIPWVTVACLAGGAVYVAASALLGVNELGGLMDAFRRRGASS